MTFFSILKNNRLKIILVISLLVASFLTLNFQNNFFQVLFSSKIWAHRVNSIEKYQEANKTFSGIECDVVFNSEINSFDVNHPPAQSINLTLFEFLKSKKNYKNFGIWLDFKNLNKLNSFQSAMKLDSIIKVLNINSKSVIVESTKPIFLEPFLNKGFKTSYYIPQNLTNLNKENLLKQINYTHSLIDSKKINFLSSDVKDYSFLKENFPNSIILTWIMNEPPKIKNPYTLKRSVLHFKRNFSLLNDKKVKVVLFTFNAKKGNR